MVKKGRHRRFEEARALKRTDNIDLDAILDNISPEDGADNTYKPEHDAWADLAAEYESKTDAVATNAVSDDSGDDESSEGVAGEDEEEQADA